MDEPKVCGQPCEVYSRVCGYMRPVKAWNKGKRTEYKQRLPFVQPDLTDQATVDKINASVQRRFGNF